MDRQKIAKNNTIGGSLDIVLLAQLTEKFEMCFCYVLRTFNYAGLWPPVKDRMLGRNECAYDDVCG